MAHQPMWPFVDPFNGLEGFNAINLPLSKRDVDETSQVQDTNTINFINEVNEAFSKGQLIWDGKHISIGHTGTELSKRNSGMQPEKEFMEQEFSKLVSDCKGFLTAHPDEWKRFLDLCIGKKVDDGGKQEGEFVRIELEKLVGSVRVFVQKNPWEWARIAKEVFGHHVVGTLTSSEYGGFAPTTTSVEATGYGKSAPTPSAVEPSGYDKSATTPSPVTVDGYGYSAPTPSSVQVPGYGPAPTTSSVQAPGYGSVPTTSSVQAPGYDSVPTPSSVSAPGYGPASTPAPVNTPSYGSISARDEKKEITPVACISNPWSCYKAYWNGIGEVIEDSFVDNLNGTTNSTEKREITDSPSEEAITLLREHYDDSDMPQALRQEYFNTKPVNITAFNGTQYDGPRKEIKTASSTGHNQLWQSAKSGYDSAVSKASHSIDHAGHKLGLWDESNSTSIYHSDPVLGFKTSTISAVPTSSSTSIPIMSPSDPAKHATSKSTTTGVSFLGGFIVIAIIVYLGFLFRRRIFKKKAGRYAHLGEVGEVGEEGARRGSTWKQQANGDRGILAHEFEDFAVGDDEEEAVGGHGESTYVR